MDGAWVRVRAGEVRALADDVRVLGRATAGAGDVEWFAVAAGEYRDLVTGDAARLAGLAAALDDVGTALDVHARALDTVADPVLAAAVVALHLARLL